MKFRYRGHQQEKFVVKVQFAGLNEMFIICGSENAKVFIWHKNSQEPVRVLEGHNL